MIVADYLTRGSTLWGRLWPNVESREQIEARAVETILEDDPEKVFPWLVPTRTSNPKAGGRPTTPADVHPLQIYWGMPRRIRLLFQSVQGRGCGVTAAEDSIVVAGYRTRNYGTSYSEGFEHPLTPHYRQKAGPSRSFPFIPTPGESAIGCGRVSSSGARTAFASLHASFATGGSRDGVAWVMPGSPHSVTTWTT